MINVKVDLDAIRYGVMHPEYQRHTNFMVSKAINSMLYDTRERQVSRRPFGEIKTVMRTKKDDGGAILKKWEERRLRFNYKPGSGEIDKYIKGSATSWTKRGFRVQGSNKSNLSGLLYFNEDRYYMKWMIYGGTALPKFRSIKSPVFDKGESRVKLNQFGGIRGGKTAVTKLKARPRVFVGIPRGREGDQYYGVWERYGRGKKKKIRKLIEFDKSRQQRAQYPADQLAAKYFDQHFERKLREAFRYATGLKDFRAPPGRIFGGGY